MVAGVLRWRCASVGLRRLMSTQAEPEFVVDKTVLSKLRKKTGYPLIKCKNALQKFNNDLKQVEYFTKLISN